VLAKQVAVAGGDPSTVQVTVTPIVPFVENDPTGTGLAAASFPLMLGGILISLLVVGAWRRLAALVAFAVPVGLILAGILHSWFGHLPGEFWMSASVMAVSILATSAFIVGCASIFGRPGVGIGAVVTMLFANPISAAAVPWQFLPARWGIIGQWFVPGASDTLVKSGSYFPDADASQQWWILVGWIALGVVLTLISPGGARTGRAQNAGPLSRVGWLSSPARLS